MKYSHFHTKQLILYRLVVFCICWCCWHQLTGQALAKINIGWEEVATFPMPASVNTTDEATIYALVDGQLAVVQSDSAACKLSIFSSSTPESAPIAETQLPFARQDLRQLLVSPAGLICIVATKQETSSIKACLISVPPSMDPIRIQWLPTLNRKGNFVQGWSSNNTLYIWLDRLSTNEDARTTDFLSLALDPIPTSWATLPSLPGTAPQVANLSLQNDGLREALYAEVKTSQTHSTPTLFKYDWQLQEWQNLTAFPPRKTQEKWLPHLGIPFGSADILYASQQAEGPAEAALFLFHTITKTWRAIGPIDLPLSFPPVAHEGQDLLIIESDRASSVIKLKKLFLQVDQQKFSLLNTVIIFCYFIVLLLLGFYFSRRQTTADDYFKGGQRIPWWAAGLSIYGTGLSAISFMAVPAKTYTTDWAYFMTKLPLILIPIIVSSLFIPFYRKLDITSAYEYLQQRFNLATRLVGSFSFIVFQLGRIGVILYLPAIALNVVTGWDAVFCILLMGVVSLIYTLMGGIEAVIWTDVLQVIVLVGGIILCLTLISLEAEGGMQAVIATGVADQKFELLNMALDWQQPTFWVVVLSGFFSNLITYSTDQSMVQRYLTTKNMKAAKGSIWTYTWVSLSIGWIFFFVGTALYAFYKAQPEELLPAMSSNDAIFPWYIISQLPNGVSGLLIAGIFAAAMSSLSSSMNSAATAYTIDFHYTFGWRGDGLQVGRWATLVIGLAGITFALLFATLEVKSIWDEFLKIIGLITGGLGGVFLLGIISSRANGAGALIGLLGSGVVQYLLAYYQPIHFLLYTASGFLSCLLLGYIFSLLLPQYNKPVSGLNVYDR